MSAETVLTLANGRGVDLLHPSASDIDFDVVAEHLAKEARYNGATRNLFYSVAEHSVRGAVAAIELTGDRTLAAYVLLHDGHEAFLRDDTTPKKRAIAAIAEEAFGLLSAPIVKAFVLLADRFDEAIFAAAGLPMPDETQQIAIKKIDLVMFVTEWRDLMGNQPHPNWAPYSGIQPLAKAIIPWTWQTSRMEWLHRARELLPTLRRAA